MPCVQPQELWQKTGRDVDYGETICQFNDRHGRWNVLATDGRGGHDLPGGRRRSTPTSSCRSISTRSASSSATSSARASACCAPRVHHEGCVQLRRRRRDAAQVVLRDVRRLLPDLHALRLEYVIVEAETGEMGGSGSHQFTIPCDSGEDIIVYTEDGSYAANMEKADVDPLPKQTATGTVPPPEDVHTPHVGTIEAVCAFLKTKPGRDDKDAHLLRRRTDRRGGRPRRSRGQSGKAHAGPRRRAYRTGGRGDDREGHRRQGRLRRAGRPGGQGLPS